MHKSERFLRINEVFIDGVLSVDLVLCKEISHHVVEESHGGGFEVPAEGPVE